MTSHRITVKTVHAGQIAAYRETIHEYLVTVEIDYEGLLGSHGWEPAGRWGSHKDTSGLTMTEREILCLLQAIHPHAIVPQLEPDRKPEWFDTWLKRWEWDQQAGIGKALFYKEYDD